MHWFGRYQMRQDTLLKHVPLSELLQVQMHEEYKKKIQSSYQPLHPDLYTYLTPKDIFKTSFLWAIKENTEEGFRNIMTEPSPVEHFENWVCEMDAKIMLPSTLHKFGVVLDDFGLDDMLGKLMENFICPISKGQAVLHRGSHRHCARTTISGERINLVIWCRSSTFRTMEIFPKWCRECRREKRGGPSHSSPTMNQDSPKRHRGKEPAI